MVNSYGVGCSTNEQKGENEVRTDSVKVALAHTVTSFVTKRKVA
jgi:hypothetical protein